MSSLLCCSLTQRTEAVIKSTQKVFCSMRLASLTPVSFFPPLYNLFTMDVLFGSICFIVLLYPLSALPHTTLEAELYEWHEPTSSPNHAPWFMVVSNSSEQWQGPEQRQRWRLGLYFQFLPCEVIFVWLGHWTVSSQTGDTAFYVSLTLSLQVLVTAPSHSSFRLNS